MCSSDVIVQIVDARNPLLFRSQDLDTYVQEVDPGKTCMLLINKADYLTDSQRYAGITLRAYSWGTHFFKFIRTNKFIAEV